MEAITCRNNLNSRACTQRIQSMCVFVHAIQNPKERVICTFIIMHDKQWRTGIKKSIQVTAHHYENWSLCCAFSDCQKSKSQQLVIGSCVDGITMKLPINWSWAILRHMRYDFDGSHASNGHWTNEQRRCRHWWRKKHIDAADRNEMTVCIELAQLTGNQCNIDLCHSIWQMDNSIIISLVCLHLQIFRWCLCFNSIQFNWWTQNWFFQMSSHRFVFIAVSVISDVSTIQWSYHFLMLIQVLHESMSLPDSQLSH